MTIHRTGALPVSESRLASMKPRRWFRFTLRTLFVLLTFFGVWLGWNLHQVREREAILGT